MDSNTATVLCFACVFLSPAAIVGVVLRHREKMAALKIARKATPEIADELHALRSEISSLRETTTRFDMSFDAAVHSVEQRLTAVENIAPGRTYGSVQTDNETLFNRR